MRKLLLIALLTTVGYQSYSQISLTKDWEVKPAATGSLVGTAGLQTTIAYNKVTNKLYLPDRNNKINILNPSDGTLSSPATLTTLTSTEHVGWGSNYKYTKIRTTSDGAIYAGNMTLGAGVFYIYRWASETDVNPTVSAINVNFRTGDSFAVSGSGVNTIIYASGANSSEIYVCKTSDGVNFTLDHAITLGAVSDARSSISAVSNSLTSDLFINTLNVEIKRITSNAAGTITDSKSIATALISQIYSHAEYFEEGGDRFLAVSGAHNATLGLDFKVYKITDWPTPTTAVTEVGSGVLAPDSYTANANAYADATFVKNGNGTYTFYHLDTNNGLAAYTSATVLPVSLSSFTAAVKNATNTLTWSTLSETNNSGFEVQRSTDGLDFAKVDFVTSKSSTGNSTDKINYSFEDKSAPAGVSYYRIKQIDFNGESTMSNIVFVDNKLQKDAGFKVYPNPVTSVLNISTSISDLSSYKGAIYNTNGALVKYINLNESNAFDISDLTPSLYILKITKDGALVQSSTVIKK